MSKLNFSADKIECKDNKIISTTGITATSTDEQYPSAKAVYNFVGRHSILGHNIVSTEPDPQDTLLGEGIEYSDGIIEWYLKGHSIFNYTQFGNVVPVHAEKTNTDENLELERLYSCERDISFSISDQYTVLFLAVQPILTDKKGPGPITYAPFNVQVVQNDESLFKLVISSYFTPTDFVPQMGDSIRVDYYVRLVLKANQS